MTPINAGHAGSRHGFTLVELMIALVIGGLMLVTVHRLFAAVLDQTRALGQEGRQFERAANATRWLADAFSSLEVGQGRPGPFVGGSYSVAFSTWLVTGRGWPEAERVELGMRGNQFIARLRGGEMVLADSVAGVRFDYLIEHGEAAPWLPGWTSTVNPPQAVRLRLERAAMSPNLGSTVDTTILLIGERG